MGSGNKVSSEKKQEDVGPPHPDYKPVLDTSDLLDEDIHARYQQTIGMLREAVGLGRIDIQIHRTSQHPGQDTSRPSMGSSDTYP
jgi:hypothetical protein